MQLNAIYSWRQLGMKQSRSEISLLLMDFCRTFEFSSHLNIKLYSQSFFFREKQLGFHVFHDFGGIISFPAKLLHV